MSLVEQQLMIEELVMNEPLSVSQILGLSPYSSNYIIPYNQEKCKRYGLILYVTENRPGGQEEADDMEESLQRAGFEVIKREWSKCDELYELLYGTLSVRRYHCSLLFVCLCGPGAGGCLRGADGQVKPVNYYLHLLHLVLPEWTPLVSGSQIYLLTTVDRFFCCVQGESGAWG